MSSVTLGIRMRHRKVCPSVLSSVRVPYVFLSQSTPVPVSQRQLTSLGSQDRFLRERKMEGKKGGDGDEGGSLHRDVTQAAEPSQPRLLRTRIMGVPYHGRSLGSHSRGFIG